MPRFPGLPDTFIPAYRYHRSSGQAVVTLGGRDTYLGDYGTADSKQEYNRLIAEWIANGRQVVASPTGCGQACHSGRSLLDSTPTWVIRRTPPARKRDEIRVGERSYQKLTNAQSAG